jgi:hypothetical protein
VTKLGRPLPKDVVDYWPEVFSDVKLNVLPLMYLDVVQVNFKDGKTWEIKITNKTREEGWKTFERTLSDLYRHYEDRIDNIDFKLDTTRVKIDIEKSTKKFLKKRKL